MLIIRYIRKLTHGARAVFRRGGHRTAIAASPARAPGTHAEKASREQLRARARQHFVDLEFDHASAIYERLLESEPHDQDLMLRAYRAARERPDSERYHQAAARIFALSGNDHPTADLVHGVFIEYVRLAKPAVRLAPAQWLQLARRFCDDGRIVDAERLITALLRQPSPPAEMPLLLLCLAQACHQAGQAQRSNQWVAALEERYADSDAARLAGDLRRSGSLPRTLPHSAAP